MGRRAAFLYPILRPVLVVALPALVVPHLPLLSAARPSGLGFSLGVRTHLGFKTQRPPQTHLVVVWPRARQ